MPKLNNEQKEACDCDRPIIEEDILKSIDNQCNGRTLTSDGLSVNWYICKIKLV